MAALLLEIVELLRLAFRSLKDLFGFFVGRAR
jgi:hypothetical protein